MTKIKKPTKILAFALTALAMAPLACSKDKEPETPEQPMTPASEPAPPATPRTDQPYPSETPGTGTPSMDETGTGGTGTWGTDDMPDESDMPEGSGSDPTRWRNVASG